MKPVIFLSFADIKAQSFEVARMGVIQKLVKLYSIFDFIKESGRLNDRDLSYFNTVNTEMDDVQATAAINYMCDYLSRYYGKNVLILLDEYDTPLQEAYVHGYWEEMSGFIRMLFHSTFKTNTHLERAVMTGITRVSRESVFSDLNNLTVITTTSEQYATCFGFTQEEVLQALKQQGLLEQKESVKKWYDGFNFGDHQDIYNPWSITNFLKENKLKTYWANTSSNTLAGRLIQKGTPEIKIAMEDLLKGKSIEATVDEEIVFNQLDVNDEAIWSLLLASGYLKVERVPEENDDRDEDLYRLSLTNYEVQKMFRKLFRDWFGKSETRYNDFVKALLAGNVKYMNLYMNRITMETFGFFDTGKGVCGQEPERFYHGFVLGLLADSRLDYTITSNRESGFGRYDVLLEPKNQSDYAYVLEFKVQEPDREKSRQDTVNAALAQIEDKNYDAVLLARGISKERIRHYGFAFAGKQVLIGQGCRKYA